MKIKHLETIKFSSFKEDILITDNMDIITIPYLELKNNTILI